MTKSDINMPSLNRATIKKQKVTRKGSPRHRRTRITATSTPASFETIEITIVKHNAAAHLYI